MPKFDFKFSKITKAYAISAEGKLMSDRLGKLSISYLWRLVGKIMKQIGLSHMSNVIEKRRYRTWLELQGRNGAKRVIVEVINRGHRYRLAKDQNSKEKWMAQLSEGMKSDV